MKRTKTAIIFLMICTFFNGCYDPFGEEYVSFILCVNNAEVKKIKTLNYGLAYEGLAINIYELSDATVEEFIYNTNKILPVNKDTAWVNFGWYITPIDSCYKGVFDHLNWVSTTNIEKILQVIKNELKENNIFYAFYIRKFDKKIEPLEVQLFILNPITKKLYMVESIT
jgi:hypothetical protein